ncbi:MAG: hypothetical protein ACXWUG_14265, partial [Polyangiales bacterium]
CSSSEAAACLSMVATDAGSDGDSIADTAAEPCLGAPLEDTGPSVCLSAPLDTGTADTGDFDASDAADAEPAPCLKMAPDSGFD